MGVGLGLLRPGLEMGVQSPDQVQFFGSNPSRDDKSRPYLAWAWSIGVLRGLPVTEKGKTMVIL